MIWEVMYNKLKTDGFEVYTPGQHKGDCLSEYVVVKPLSSYQYNEYSSNVLYCELLCYVPQEKFSTLSDLVSRVKSSMIELYPQIKDSHWEIPGFSDDSNKSHMWSIRYEGYQKFYNYKEE